ncbi:Zcf27p [Rhizina undulata]
MADSNSVPTNQTPATFTSTPNANNKRPNPHAGKSRAASSYPRKRAVSACLVCRGRKTKCDNQRPQCGFCMQTGAECVYEAEKLATFDAASLAILDKLSKIEALLDSNSARDQNTTISSPHGSSTSGERIAGNTGRHAPGLLSPSPRHHQPQLSSPGTTFMSIQPRERVDISELFLIPITTAIGGRVESVLQWPTYRELNFQLDDLIAPIFQVSAEDNDDEDWHGGSDICGGTLSSHDNGNARRIIYDESVLESRIQHDPEEIPELVHRFFRNVHTKNPILDAAVLDGYVRYNIHHGFGWDGKTCLVLLISALGAISAPFHPNHEAPTRYPSAEIGRQYFFAAKKRLGMVMASNKLIAVQCLFLAGIYYMYTMNQFAAWKMFNAASVSCQGYLHRKEKMQYDLSELGDSSGSTRGLEQRIYWSCLKSELELCSELDTASSGLNELDYPHAFPSPPREIAASAAFQSSTTFYEQPRIPHPLAEDKPTEKRIEDEKTWFYYLAEIALRKVEIRIWKSLSGHVVGSGRPSSRGKSRESSGIMEMGASDMEDGKERVAKVEDLVNIVTEFELQLKLWYTCLPPILKFQESSQEPCDDERLQYLRGRYWWNVSRVCRPFIYYLIHRPSPSTATLSVQLKNTVERFARKGLEFDTNFILSNVITHRHHGAWLGLRATTSNALVILAARKGGLEMPSRWRDAVESAKNGLKYWMSEVRDAKVLKETIESAESGLLD